MPWTPRNESPPSLPLRDTFPSPRLREWSPTHRRSPSVKGLPSLIFVRELPVPPLREWSPTPRRTSLESFPSLVFVRELLSLLFVNGVLPLVELC
ncbi:Hypothetical protein FKW44_010034 [Caligus rogercresseyi]|uniref:Uncharacterized protein n=1 Tax=Caligus rogercresseyi TaxID=217165 RepID=A0A7T8HG02_CALRO|nr:Hypothetical protein FKW44_010034 [Caligus rogercresseyi]